MWPAFGPLRSLVKPSLPTLPTPRPCAPTNCPTSKFRPSLESTPARSHTFHSEQNPGFAALLPNQFFINKNGVTRLQIVPPSLEFTLPGDVSKLFLKLNKDFTVSVLESAQGQPTGEVGHWTFVYDQSMIVELPQRKAKYVANFRYSLKDGVLPDQYDKLKTGSYEAFDSNCSETMVGVKLGVEDKRVQCWVGYQTQPETR